MSYPVVAAGPNTELDHPDTPREGFSASTDRAIRRLLFMLLVHVVCQTVIRYLPVAWWPLASIVPVGIVAATLLKCLHDAVRCFDRYTVNENYLVIETGALSRSTRSVPLSHVRDVTVSRSIFQRMFKFGTGDIIVRTTNEAGSSEISLSPASAVTGLTLRHSNKRLETIVLRDVPEPFKHSEILLRRVLAAGGR